MLNYRQVLVLILNNYFFACKAVLLNAIIRNIFYPNSKKRFPTSNNFLHVRDFSKSQRLFSTSDAFFHFRDFSPLPRLLSTPELFLNFRDFSQLQRLLLLGDLSAPCWV